MQRIRDLPKHLDVEMDDEKRKDHLIDYQRPGWYSMDDEKIYRPGEFATYSRIRITEKPKVTCPHGISTPGRCGRCGFDWSE